MTTASELIAHAKAVRERLIHPPNAVHDDGIDLKRKKGIVTPPPPPEPSPVPEEEVNKYHALVRVVEIEKKIHHKAILRAVADQWDVEIIEIKGESRVARIVLPRMVSAYLLIKMCKLSQPQIGKLLHRDHTTILHSRRKVTKMVKEDRLFADMIQATEDMIRAGHYD